MKKSVLMLAFAGVFAAGVGVSRLATNIIHDKKNRVRVRCEDLDWASACPETVECMQYMYENQKRSENSAPENC